jgi:hypothetical protein
MAPRPTGGGGESCALKDANGRAKPGLDSEMDGSIKTS